MDIETPEPQQRHTRRTPNKQLTEGSQVEDGFVMVPSPTDKPDFFSSIVGANQKHRRSDGPGLGALKMVTRLVADTFNTVASIAVASAQSALGLLANSRSSKTLKSRKPKPADIELHNLEPVADAPDPVLPPLASKVAPRVAPMAVDPTAASPQQAPERKPTETVPAPKTEISLMGRMLLHSQELTKVYQHLPSTFRNTPHGKDLKTLVGAYAHAVTSYRKVFGRSGVSPKKQEEILASLRTALDKIGSFSGAEAGQVYQLKPDFDKALRSAIRQNQSMSSSAVRALYNTLVRAVNFIASWVVNYRFNESARIRFSPQQLLQPVFDHAKELQATLRVAPAADNNVESKASLPPSVPDRCQEDKMRDVAVKSVIDKTIADAERAAMPQIAPLSQQELEAREELLAYLREHEGKLQLFLTTLPDAYKATPNGKLFANCVAAYEQAIEQYEQLYTKRWVTPEEKSAILGPLQAALNAVGSIDPETGQHTWNAGFMASVAKACSGNAPDPTPAETKAAQSKSTAVMRAMLIDGGALNRAAKTQAESRPEIRPATERRPTPAA